MEILNESRKNVFFFLKQILDSSLFDIFSFSNLSTIIFLYIIIRYIHNGNSFFLVFFFFRKKSRKNGSTISIDDSFELEFLIIKEKLEN